MQARQFLETVLSNQGYYCGYGIKLGSDRVQQKFFTSLEALETYTESLVEAGWNAYFALATFENSGSRTQNNAKHLKSFFIDIDAGEGKPYADPVDCIRALKSFCSANKFPRPTMVGSGRGVHAYWSLDEPIEAALWTPVAEQFKALLASEGMRVDPAVTADSARILRMPGTLNFKSDPALEVSLLSPIAAPVAFTAFAALVAHAPAPVINKLAVGSFVPREMNDVNQALSGSYISVFKNILEKTAAGRGCEQIKRVIEEASTLDEPMWRAGLSIAKFCTDGGKAIHRISKAHPGYTFEATEAKAELIKGPYTCATFDNYSPGICEKCPHKNAIKSPIALGREVQEASDEDNVVLDVPEVANFVAKQTYVIPKYPVPYFRGKAGGVFKRAKDKQGDPIEVPVYHNDFYVLKRLNDPDAGEAVVMRLHLPQDGVREFTVPLVSLLSKDEFRRHVAPHGLAVIDMEGLMAYVSAWVNNLQANAKAEKAHRQFGWVDSRYDSFIVGDKDIRSDRVDHNPPSSATVKMFGTFQTKGTLEGWNNVMDFYNRPGLEMHQFVIGLSFGSPLMQFATQHACVFHIYSPDPGLGKTTAMLAGASIWGNPDEIMSHERDTIASKFNRTEIYKNIFHPIDELSNIHPKEASDFLYQTTGGHQRNRMSGKSNEERYRGDPWHLNICTTGNTSLLDRVSMYKAIPKAEATRVLEYQAKAFVFEAKTETDALNRYLSNNYGHACVPYLQYIMQDVDGAQKLFQQTQEKLDLIGDLSQPHRFWSAQAASAFTGLIIARRAGLVKFSIPPIIKWWAETIQKAKERLLGMEGSIEETLTAYLAENYNNILRIKSTSDARTPNQDDALIIPDSTPRMTLVARYEYDIKRLYLLPKPFREWCNKQQIHYPSLYDKLRSGSTSGQMKKVRISRGTRLNLPPADCVVLDCSQFMDEEMEQSIASAAIGNAIPV
jgi:hypothetical protein